MLTETQKQIVINASSFFNGWCQSKDPNMIDAILNLTDSSVQDEEIVLQELEWIVKEGPERAIAVGDTFTKRIVKGCLEGIDARLMLEEEWIKNKTLEEVESEYQKLFEILNK